MQHSEGTTSAFSRDTQNRIKSIQSTDGTSIGCQYNTAGDLRVVKGAEGFETRFDYAGDGKNRSR